MFSKLQSLHHLKSTLARNAAWMLGGQGFKLLIQALYFTIIARSLGAQNYGAFVGVVGLVGILLPFATMGSGFLLIKNVARDKRQFQRNFGCALLTTMLSAAFSFAVVVGISHFLFPSKIPTKLVMMVAASDLFCASIATICAHAFIAFERMKWTASINVLLSALRLAAAVVLATAHRNPTALEWGEFYLSSTTIVALVAFILVLTKLGAPAFAFARPATEIREGFYFSVAQSAQTIVAAYPSFFRVGVDGIPATLRYMRPLMLRALGYATFVAFVLVVGAGGVPVILGKEYRLTSEALRWLAVLPLLKAIHSFLADALTGAGALRTAITASVAMFNVCINMWIIPAYSWRGAAWSSIASDALLLGAFATTIFVLVRRSQHLAARAEVIEVRAEA